MMINSYTFLKLVFYFQTVETAPKTKRKCGSKNVLENECRDVLYGQNSMLACYCNENDYCNGSGHPSPIPYWLIITLPIIRFFTV